MAKLYFRYGMIYQLCVLRRSAMSYLQAIILGLVQGLHLLFQLGRGSLVLWQGLNAEVNGMKGKGRKCAVGRAFRASVVHRQKLNQRQPCLPAEGGKGHQVGIFADTTATLGF